jgi:hypothetical protein
MDFKGYVSQDSQWFPKREDHVMGVEGAAYKFRYRPGAGKLHNG